MQTNLHQPARGAGAIPRGLTLQERKRRKLLYNLARLRKEASKEIDRLIAFLDASDAYVVTELEDAVDDHPCDTDELELSFCGITASPCGGINPNWLAWSDNHGDELELDTSDDEPDLGSVEGGGYGVGQEKWAQGAGDDREHDAGDDRETEDEHGETDVPGVLTADDEPSIGECAFGVDLELDESDKEPLLGWAENINQGPGNLGRTCVGEGEQAATPLKFLRRAFARPRVSKGVEVVPTFAGARKLLRNLTPAQLAMVSPRLSREVGISSERTS